MNFCRAAKDALLHEQFDSMTRFREFFASLARPFGRESTLLLLRMWLGVMMVYHGSDKLFRSFETFTTHINTFGIPLSNFIGVFVIASQVVGGVLIFFGFLTRPALACVLITVFAAVMESMFFINYNPFTRKGELALTYTVVTFALFITGPGIYSVDAQLGKAKETGFEDVPHEQWHKSE